MTNTHLDTVAAKRFDTLDRRLDAGEISQAVYDREIEAVRLWIAMHDLAAFERQITEAV